jgi:hypothetical protein
LALERVGPTHTRESIGYAGRSDAWDEFPKEVPEDQRGRCVSMRGRDITAITRPAHLLFEKLPWAMVGGRTTIGIGDGGNEIGMGKVPFATVAKNIPNGDVVAGRTATDHLIVAGISNWGAWALAAGVMVLRGKVDAGLFDADHEHELLKHLVERGPLVDGLNGLRTATVDGLAFDEYAKPLRRIASALALPSDPGGVAAISRG